MKISEVVKRQFADRGRVRRLLLTGALKVVVKLVPDHVVFLQRIDALEEQARLLAEAARREGLVGKSFGGDEQDDDEPVIN